MSYAMAAALQVAVFEALSGDAALAGLVGTAVFDAVPQPAPDLFVVLGPEDVTSAGDATASGSVHRIVVSVVTARDGYADAKAAAVRVSQVLEGAAWALPSGRVVSVRFEAGKARRDEGEDVRRVDLRFRVRVDGEQQGVVA